MLLAHHRDAIAVLREPTEHDPWRGLVSGCLAGWGCGIDGTDYGLTRARGDWWSTPELRLSPFCPEQHALGTPRSMPDIHGGDGADVVAGRARVVDEHGRDLIQAMLDGACAMLAFARDNRGELAILTDMSAACGRQVISNGCRLVPDRRYQRGIGVATALLLEAGIPVVAQRRPPNARAATRAARARFRGAAGGARSRTGRFHELVREVQHSCSIQGSA